MIPTRIQNTLNSIEEIHNITSLQDVNTDIITCLLGEKLGSGSYRAVYQHNWDKNWVIKVEPKNTECNLTEYILWNEICGLKGNLE